MKPVLLSICDYSGVWSRPYVGEARVIRVDPKYSGEDLGERGLTTERMSRGVRNPIPTEDGGEALPVTVGALLSLLRTDPEVFGTVRGLLLQPPCTDFARSGARHWREKDADGRTDKSVAIVMDCLRLVHLLRPTLQFWCLENPVGRLKDFFDDLHKPRMTFDPCEYAGWADDPEAEAYTKKTCLWGEFRTDLPRKLVKPVILTKVSKKTGREYSGSRVWMGSGGAEAYTKEKRSLTPTGFARAFQKANRLENG